MTVLRLASTSRSTAALLLLLQVLILVLQSEVQPLSLAATTGFNDARFQLF